MKDLIPFRSNEIDDDLSVPISRTRPLFPSYTYPDLTPETNENDVAISRINASYKMEIARIQADAMETHSMISELGKAVLEMIKSNPGKSSYAGDISDNKWFGKKYKIRINCR